MTDSHELPEPVRAPAPAPPDAALASALLRERFPEFAELTPVPVPSAGTDNALFRLGESLVLRMPRVPWAQHQPAREAAWLPWLGPRLPLPIPEHVALGAPGRHWPWHCAVHRWQPGVPLDRARGARDCADAQRLGEFVAALGRLDGSSGPAAGEANNSRGLPLAARAAAVEQACAALAGEVDVPVVRALWARDSAAPAHPGPGCWLHGDLHEGNLLEDDPLQHARPGAAIGLRAVIDFGTFGVGDPAVDLLPAWNLFSGEARAVFREASGADPDRWARGRAWALSVALVALPFYLERNPVIVAQSRRVIDAITEDG